MRQVWILAVMMGLLCLAGMVYAAPTLTLTTTVGYNGYYRPRTLVPVIVDVQNDGGDISGEFHVSASRKEALADRYVSLVTIPKGAKQRHFLYIIPQVFSQEITVEFWSKGKQEVTSTFTRCQELYDQNRLLVIVGGSGSSLSYLNSLSITASEYIMPRAWDFGGWFIWQQRGGGGPRHYGRSGPAGTRGATGVMHLAYVPGDMLPDNPEAYGSITMLALMSNITENTLADAAQKAIPLWVANGGHLLIAGGGVAARLQAPFFTSLIPTKGETLTVDGGKVIAAPYAAGRVTALKFDPDAVVADDWHNAATFYSKLMARDPRTPLTFALNDALNRSTLVRNLRPPDLKLIIIFLLIYLVMLVPVNYFVLKRMDKRELAWLTTPAIVLVFTVGAYGIGYMTKGHRLVLNMVSVMEMTGKMKSAEATSELLIFSPSRTNYRMSLGDDGLLVREKQSDQEMYAYGGGYRQPGDQRVAPLNIATTGNRIELDNVRVSMWDFRQFVLAHRVNMGNGFTTTLQAGQPATAPRATGSITNNTPYRFELCELYADGSQVATFAMNPGQTVIVNQASAATPKFNEDEQYMWESVKDSVRAQFSGNGALAKGMVLVGYTRNLDTGLRVNRTTPTAKLGVVVVHL
ncbi:MAG: hypothetical protein ACYDBB_26870 [Armatimonadota bacterium]